MMSKQDSGGPRTFHKGLWWVWAEQIVGDGKGLMYV